MIRAAVIWLAVIAGAAWAEPRVSLVPFEKLDGWADDNQDAALAVFVETCDKLRDPTWRPICAIAETATDGRAFFELVFQPVQIDDGSPALFTGYFEPELRGSRHRSPAYPYPVYRFPPEAANTRPWLTRRDIETSSVMRGRGLEIAYVDDAVDLFFLQIQGSGRIRLDDGSVIRVGYGGANGRPYSSAGARLVQRGIFNRHQVSAAVIRNWVRENPRQGLDLLRETQSYVFFREVNHVESARGPLGALQRSITAMRSVAVDPDYTPLGAPVWVEKDGASPLRQLMIAQDTGSAIKGSQRADIFYGSGNDAGRTAGGIKDGGRMIVLMPIQRAYAMLPDRVQ